MMFFELFSTGFMCVFYGIVITSGIMALLYLGLRQLNRGIVSSMPFYIPGIVMFILLTIQLSLLVGAFEAKGYVDGIESYVAQLVEGMTGVLSAQESQVILEKVTEESPLLGVYFDVCNFSGNEIEDLPQVMAETLRENLVSYIWHRVWWSAGIILLGVVIAIGARKRPTSYNFDSSLEDLGIS